MLTRARRPSAGRGQARLALAFAALLTLGPPWLPARPASAGPPDIYYIWRDGVRLAEGVNPYGYDHPPEPAERPTKHPSYLPLFYLAVAVVYKLGVHDYTTWLALWRVARIVTHVAIAVLLYCAGQRAGRRLLGLLGAVFWSLDRWTLYTVRAGGLDQPALLLLLLSLECFGRRRRLACLLLGTSLAIKHVGLLVAPLYLVWTWQRAERDPRPERWMRTAEAALWIALVPLIVSLPFLAWDASAFAQSILSPVTRPPDGYAHVSAVGSLLGLRGGMARVPLLFLTALILLVAAYRQVIGRYTTVLFMFTAFTDFNTVLFPQYFAWVIPFIVLAAGERAETRPRDAPGVT
jgi:uncharacterized membrane protein